MKRSALLTRTDNGVDCTPADILHRGQTEADAVRGDDKIGHALIDVGWQHIELHALALVEQNHHAVGAAHFTAEG